MNQRLIKNVLFIVISISSSVCFAEAVQIKMLFVGDKQSSAFKGVSQGIDEANLQGQFLGQEYELLSSTLENIGEINPKDVIAIMVASSKNDLINIIESFPRHPVFNLTLENDELRANCRENLLNIIPSSAMKQDALGQWQQKKPDSKATPQAWHHTFKKYAASQLNDRFEKGQKIDMDDESWSGWAAAKMVSDTVARDNIQKSENMLNFLKENLVFDGQKGINMTFRVTGQLRQPLLMIENDKIVAEAPVRGVVKTTDLDSLGITECAK